MKKQINAVISTTTKKVDEVFLFTELMNNLNNNNASSCFVKSVHSNAGYIDYFSTMTNSIKKIEIADLLIINHNTTKNETRICFLQAKYKKNSYKSFLSFNGDALQWELLRTKPDVIDTYNNGFPSDILNFTKYQTITSYGIFYKDVLNQVDLLFTLPEHLAPSKFQKRTTLKFNGTGNCPIHNCTKGVCPKETISICYLDGFENELYRGNIGAPLDMAKKKYVSRLLKTIHQNTENSFILRFSELSGIEFNEFTESAPYINTAILITNGKNNV